MADFSNRGGSDCGDEGERGKRGKRGHDGATGPAGSGSTGPTGPTGTAEILHVEAKQQQKLPLPPNKLTTVLATPPFTAPAGWIVQITSIVEYSVVGNSNAFAVASVNLLVDGVLSGVGYAATPGAVPSGATFFLFAPLPLTTWLVSDGLPHVYALAIQTDSTSDGDQLALDASIFINAVPPP